MFGMGTGVALTLWSPANMTRVVLSGAGRLEADAHWEWNCLWRRAPWADEGRGCGECGADACVCSSMDPLTPGGGEGRSSRTGDEDRYAWHVLPRVHGRPRDGVVSPGPLVPSRGMGAFILGTASHLDAFSGYPYRSSLPGGALGRTAGTRADRPTRSSRTRVRAPQCSSAHDGYRPNCLTTF